MKQNNIKKWILEKLVRYHAKPIFKESNINVADFFHCKKLNLRFDIDSEPKVMPAQKLEIQKADGSKHTYQLCQGEVGGYFNPNEEDIINIILPETSTLRKSIHETIEHEIVHAYHFRYNPSVRDTFEVSREKGTIAADKLRVRSEVKLIGDLAPEEIRQAYLDFENALSAHNLAAEIMAHGYERLKHKDRQRIGVIDFDGKRKEDFPFIAQSMRDGIGMLNDCPANLTIDQLLTRMQKYPISQTNLMHGLVLGLDADFNKPPEVELKEHQKLDKTIFIIRYPRIPLEAARERLKEMFYQDCSELSKNMLDMERRNLEAIACAIENYAR